MTASLIGATGLIGQYLLEELLRSNAYDKIRVLVRRPVELTDPRLEILRVDFTDEEGLRSALEGSDTIFCSVGTTQKKVKGDKAAYRKVDFDIPLTAARLGKMAGCSTFVIVTAVSANAKSNNFYLRLKGEVEEALRTVGLDSVHIMRPSILLGERKESRFGERIWISVMTTLSFMIPSKYKPIHGRAVAKAMLQASKEKKKGVFIYEYREMKQLGK